MKFKAYIAWSKKLKLNKLHLSHNFNITITKFLKVFFLSS